MKKAIEDIVKIHLDKRLERIWNNCLSTGMNIPYTVVEAGFNSLLLASIDEYIMENDEGYSYVISEAFVERDNGNKGVSNGRCDIIWYREDDVCYFELKDSTYGSSLQKDIKNSRDSIKDAQGQIDKINYEYNESYYYKSRENPELWKEERKRYACCLKLIQSVVRDGESNFDGLKTLIEQDDELTLFGYNRFSDNEKTLMTHKDTWYENDGYFVVGTFGTFPEKQI